jgi:serine/threonine protein kinase
LVRTTLGIVLLALSGWAAVGCGGDDAVYVADWQLDAPTGRRAVTLPVHLDRWLPSAPSRYALRTELRVPERWRGKAVTLSIPYFTGLTTLWINGREAHNGYPQPHARYRSSGSHAWRVPAEMTARGSLALTLAVQHTCTWTAWLDTVPRLTVGGDPLTGFVYGFNSLVSVMGLGMFWIFAATYLVVYMHFRRREYLILFGQALMSMYYFVFVHGVSQILTGRFDLFFLATTLAGAAVLAVHSTSHRFDLPPASRWWPALLVLSVGVAFTGAGPSLYTKWAAPIVLITVALAGGFHLLVLSRLFRAGRRDAHVVLHLVIWVLLTCSMPFDGMALLGGGELLGGTRVAVLGILLYALLDFCGLGVRLVQSMRTGERLNQDLQRQIAERSLELSVALARLSHAGARAQLAVGDLVEGRYQIVRSVGRGAWGEVYEVRRVSDNARLAIKVLTNDDAVVKMARFAREVHLAADMSHPNVVAILDFGLAEQGFMYLVMEFVDGLSLDRARDRYGELPWALPILRATASGLAAVHDKGIVHRDLKPANILLTGDAALVRLTDFGIAGAASLPAPRSQPLRELAGGEASRSWTRPSVPAERAAPMVSDQIATQTGRGMVVSALNRRSGAAGRGDEHLTATGMYMGTPRYMAPELADGRRNDDPATDIYAFGIIAFELITGTTPFKMPQCWSRLRNLPLEPAPVLDPALLVPPQFGELVSRCLQVEPHWRPTAPELVEALTLACNQLASTRLRA